jgi:PAS domain S-box-containing protein
MRRPVLVLVFLVTAFCALLLTLGAWLLARRDAEADARGRFDLRTAEIVLAIKGRMLDYEQVLRGAAGLFAASESVERAEWRAYVAAAQVERVYPGLLGLGYVPWLTPAGKAEAERAARRDGLADYAVFPPGERPVYAPVFYFEPPTDRNRRVFGFDMHTEPMRRAAMERARDTGTASITQALRLVQDPDPRAPIGFLMYLPVYRNGASVETVAERRAALQGFIYAPFRFNDLMAGSIGATPGLEMRLADVTEGSAELFSSAAAASGAGREAVALAPRFTRTDTFRVAQRAWRLDAASLPAFEADIASERPALVLASGLAVTALLLVVVWSLATTRERARELAQHMTVALRASEERLQLALASSHLTLFDWDAASGLVQLSAEWSAMLGGPSEPTLVPIQKLQLLDHPEDQAAVRAKVGPLLRGEADECRYEHRVRRLDGRWKWIETTARVNERAPDGRALRITGANADIDERKAVERLKSEFIATVSHELRTPLTSMLGSLGLLREGSAGELAPEARQFVDVAYANCERLAELVNDILDMERIEAGRMDLRIETVDVEPLLARALELNGAYAQRYGARFALAPGAAGLRARADPDRLMQVLANLLSNAAKHSPAGGEVTVRAQAAAGAEATAVRVSVTDRGAGIAPAFRARLFGKFEQADRKRGGTGLGLAISKALVERMQGRIGCDSEPGRGSTFWIELPRA